MGTASRGFGPAVALPYMPGRALEQNEQNNDDESYIIPEYQFLAWQWGADARHLYDVVLASQQAGRARVAARVPCADVDRASRDVITDAGWGDAFSHSTGHGVGLEIHEAPRVAATGRDTLVISDVVTVEPGVYLPGIGGVRIEDTVVVGAAGSEPLTLTPKDLVL